MLKRSLIAAAIATSLAAPAIAGDSPISANIAFVSDYQYRGFSQTKENMAIQGGFDYAHDAGFYAGVWGSNVDWLDKGSLEVDVYGGFKNSIGDFGYDVGLLQYVYPGGEVGGQSADTTEAYIGLSWKFLTFKYSYSFTDLFGAADSDGSEYYDLSASQEIGGFTLGAHVGRQKIVNGTSYNDWKLGVSKDYAGFTFGLAYVDTDVDNDDNADARVILSVSRSF